MEEIAHFINGIRIDDSLCSVQQGSTLLAAISPNRSVITVPGRHGSVPTGMPPSFAERSVSIKCKAFLGSYRIGLERMAMLCSQPEVMLGRRFGSSPMQTARAELSSFETDEANVLNGVVAPFTAVFALPGVWWRSVARSTGVGAGDGYVALNGDAPVADAIIRFDNAAGVSLTDRTTGTGLSWAGAQHTHVFLDAGRMVAWANGNAEAWSPDVDGSVDVSGGLDYPASGPLQLWPDTQGRAAVHSSTACTIRLQDSYW